MLLKIQHLSSDQNVHYFVKKKVLIWREYIYKIALAFDSILT